MAKSKSGLCRHNHSFHLKLFPSLSRQERCWYRGSVFVARKIPLSSFSSYFCRGGPSFFCVFLKIFCLVSSKEDKQKRRARIISIILRVFSVSFLRAAAPTLFARPTFVVSKSRVRGDTDLSVARPGGRLNFEALLSTHFEFARARFDCRCVHLELDGRWTVVVASRPVARERVEGETRVYVVQTRRRVDGR